MISDIRPALANLTGTPVAAPAAKPMETTSVAAPPSDRAELSGAPAVEKKSLSAWRAEVAAEAASFEAKLAPHREGEVLVKVKPGTTLESFKQLAADFSLQIVEKFDIPESMRQAIGGDVYLVKSPLMKTGETMAILGRQSMVSYAASNDELHLIQPTEMGQPEAPPKVLMADDNVPNDLDSKLWGMRNTGQDGGKAGADIDATKAWTIQTGNKSGEGPVIGVIDTGIDYTHPDLKNNIWNNPDPNAPDRHGYNFAGNSPDPMDDHSHGTHCSGTIAGEGNNGEGVVGVNWNARLMGLKFLTAGGSGSTADAVRAVLYATDHGARITSNSWGGGGFNQALYDALKASPALHIFAAGNEKNDNDARPSYPASYNLDNIVAVAASDRNDQRASFSNYGKTSVDVAAPGKDIYSTVPQGKFASYSGTSMATPHVAGLAGLIASQFPGISNEQLKSRILNTVDKLDNWKNVVATGGRVNAFNALENDSVAPAAASDLGATATSATKAQVRWTATGDDGLEGTAGGYNLRWSDKPISINGNDGSVAFETAFPVETGTPQASGSPEQAEFSVPPSGRERTLYVALQVTDNVGNPSELAVTTVTIPAANVAFEGNEAGNWTADAPWALADDVWSSSTGQQANNANVSLTTRPLDLSTMKGATLCYTGSRDLEAGYDYVRVEASADGGKTWSELSKETGAADFTPSTIDLSTFDGKSSVVVRFRVTTDGSQQSVGVKVKDVVVAGEQA